MSEKGQANAKFQIENSGKEIKEDLEMLALANNFQKKVDRLGDLAAAIHARLAAEVDFAKSSGSEEDLEKIQEKISQIAQICLKEIHGSQARIPRLVSFTSDGRPYRDPFTQTLHDGHG